jgi:predicted Fe-Mo cluster-binding NifX family protein
MKIAVACEGKTVAQHFGHCEGFTIFEAQGQQITDRQFIPNPGHKPGFLPVFLSEKGANVIISGGMGGGAVDLFNEKGIQVITGASGDAEAAVRAYLQGTLKSTGSVCHEHQYAGECGEHQH